MPHLIAQGEAPQHRWRRLVTPGVTIALGRAAGLWSTPWDSQISRKHVTLQLENGRLLVRVSPEARNPVFYRGRRASEFVLRPGEHFVIGGTTFTLADEQAFISALAPPPSTERTFAAEELAELVYRQADRRLESLSRLPEIIYSSASEQELHIRLVNLVLAAIEQASAAAIVRLAEGDEPAAVLHWDRRVLAAVDFHPSERLIRDAVEKERSVAWLWSALASDAGGSGSEYTSSGGCDWAFCTPVPGAACRGWAIYVAGVFGGQMPTPPEGVELDALREEIKFAELTADILSALREARLLTQRQASLKPFFAPVVLEALAEHDPAAVLAPREAEVTVLFCDLRGFSRSSEQMAGKLGEWLGQVSQALGVATHHILETGGVVGDFHGDAVMGFWGWPFSQADAPLRACQAARAIAAEFAAFSRDPAHPLAGFRLGLGLASGRAVAGKIGTADQVKVTVFGPVVNLADRLQHLTKTLRAPILLDDVTAAGVEKTLPAAVGRVRRLAQVRPPGLATPLAVWELLPPASAEAALSDVHLAAFSAALAAFERGDWPTALRQLHLVPPDDLAKDFLLLYIARHNRTPPPGWNGVVEMPAAGG